MVKRAKFFTYNVLSSFKTGYFTKVYSQKVLQFQKNIHTFAVTVSTMLSTCTANQGGTFAFYNPNNRIFKDDAWGDYIMPLQHLIINHKNYKKSLTVSNIQRIFATIIKERKAIWKQKTIRYKFILQTTKTSTIFFLLIAKLQCLHFRKDTQLDSLPSTRLRFNEKLQDEKVFTQKYPAKAESILSSCFVIKPTTNNKLELTIEIDYNKEDLR